ncbi:hypothetical protein Emag_004207 [Eimeria magna]
MVCLPLSDTGAPLERLAGWRLVFFVILEFSLCLLFSLRQPSPEAQKPRSLWRTPQTHEHEKRPDDYFPFLWVYRHSSWVQDLLPDLSEKQQEADHMEWEPHAELYSMLDANLLEHLFPASEEGLFARQVLTADS